MQLGGAFPHVIDCVNSGCVEIRAAGKGMHGHSIPHNGEHQPAGLFRDLDGPSNLQRVRPYPLGPLHAGREHSAGFTSRIWKSNLL